jgi:para-aminobenzoate synthetase component 1
MKQSSGKLTSTFTKAAYINAIARAKEHIVAGDIYQVNLSQRFSLPWGESPWELYKRLQRINPAPFAAYLHYPGFAVVSASPERFLRRTGDLIETRPIKGTRPRGKRPVEDRRLAQELEASAKDRAEHIMIVDLERNDLGRVAEIGSVRVAKMMALERFPTVHHLVSTIQARLPREKSVGDLLRATFPGGSITGAPKIRSMEIIDELEPMSRGVYTGAIGYLSATGDLDLNIAIRTLVVKNGVAHFHAGGGIVHDSGPAAEYQETLDKAKALFDALGVS